MSWSFNAIGKPKAVLQKIYTDISNSSYKCPEPEEAVRLKLVEILELALNAFPESSAVKVEAHGSQIPEYVYGASSSQPTGKFTNSLKLVIEPIYGFIE